MSAPAFPSARRLATLLSLSVAGAALSLYSVAETLRLLDGGRGGGLCSISAAVDCEVAHASKHAFLFGVPVAAYALLLYAWAAVALVVACLRPASRAATVRAVLVASLAALGVTLWKAAVLAFVVRVVCPVCVTLYAVNVALVLLCMPRPGASLARGARAIARSVRLVAGRALSWARPWPVAAHLAVLVAVVVGGAWATTRIAGGAVSDRTAWVLGEVVGFSRGPVVAVEVPADAPRLGREDAPVRVVVFSDFQCPWCRTAARTLSAFARVHADAVRVDFVHLPLDRTVNPHVRSAGHPMAGLAARLSVLAQRAGRFWEYHDAVFAREDLDRAALDDWFRAAGFPAAEVEAAAEDPATEAVVRAHVAVAHRMGILGTPAVFVNGRRIERFQPDVLEGVLRRELERVAPDGGALSLARSR